MARDSKSVHLSELSHFDEVIDARSPSEFAEDHIPGAGSFPVLSDAERADIGTRHAADSFEAKKAGAARVARNIAQHLEQTFNARARNWRPLVYCWRGGARSRAMTHILREVGWDAQQLAGGYKAYRRQVMSDLAIWPQQFHFTVICGATGSGKSRLLQTLAARGEQVLDLEDLAQHRGSILGSLPGQAQPAQRWFESLLWRALQDYSPQRTVYVEAESRKIGALQLPDALIQRMWLGDCVFIDAPAAERTRFLMSEYAHFLREPEALCATLERLRALHGADTIGHWQQLARAGAWNDLVQTLLTQHYDPAYRRSTLTNFASAKEARRIACADLSAAGLDALAAEVVVPAPRTELAA